MSAVAERALCDVTVGKARTAKNLVLIPLSGNKKSRVRYILIDWASPRWMKAETSPG
jgi:hypothetical protein